MKKMFGKRLSLCTTFKIGGPAYCWIEAECPNDVIEAVDLAEKEDRRMIIMGNGSNFLVSDKGFDGIVVHLTGEFNSLSLTGDHTLKAGAASHLGELVKFCGESGLSGAEFLAGIPGTVGGAVFMNAGCYGKEIKDIIDNVEILDLRKKTRRVLKKEDIRFSYRNSGLRDACIFGAELALKKDGSENIKSKIDGFMKKRAWMREINNPSAGSVFKNPSSGMSAGSIIEQCGLKGRRIGGAEISAVHANFIVNTGSACSRDVIALIELARERAEEKFGITMKPEIKVI